MVGVLVDLVRGLRALDVPFCLIGALVPELLLDVPPRRRTNDADATVVVTTLADFEELKARLDGFGFNQTRRPYRLERRGGGWVDLLPYSASIAPDDTLVLAPDLSFNMAGFRHVVPHAIDVSIAPELTVPVVPLPLYVLLKLVAFGDRKAPKDMASVLHCLRHYEADGDRRYGLDHDGEPVPFDRGRAYLLGLDGRPFHDATFIGAVTAVVDRFADPDDP